MTPDLLQTVLAEELRLIFRDTPLHVSSGQKRNVQVYEQYLPEKKGDDDEATGENMPEPYAIVRVSGGRVPDEDAAHDITAVVILCVCDTDGSRQGHKDILHLINRVYSRFARNPLLGSRFLFKYPMEWTLQDDPDYSTYPYYFGGIQMHFDAPAIEKEDPYA